MKDIKEYFESLKREDVYLIPENSDNIIKDIITKSKLNIEIIKDYFLKFNDIDADINEHSTPIVVHVPNGYIPLQNMNVNIIKDKNGKEIPIICIESNINPK